MKNKLIIDIEISHHVKPHWGTGDIWAIRNRNDPPPKKNRLNYAKLEYHKKRLEYPTPTQHINQPKLKRLLDIAMDGWNDVVRAILGNDYLGEGEQ